MDHFETAALQGVFDAVHALQTRLDAKGLRRFPDGAYLAIWEYEVVTAVRLAERRRTAAARREMMKKLRRRRRTIRDRAARLALR